MANQPQVTLRIKVDARDGTATVEGFANKVEESSKKSSRSFDDVTAAAKRIGMATAAAAAAVLAGVGTITRSAINSADAFDDMSQRTGVAAKELSTLAYAAQRGGLDVGTFESGLVKLTKSASDAARGTGEARAGFDALGVSVTNADGSLKSSDVLLREVATQFAGMEDSANKTALAVNLFGRAGADMIPMLNQGAEGISEVQQRARDLGLEIDNTTAALAGDFNDSLDDMQSLVKGLGIDVAKQLLPSLTLLADEVVNNGTAMRQAGGFAEVLATGFKYLIGGAYVAKSAIVSLTNVIAAQADVAVATYDVLRSLDPTQRAVALARGEMLDTGRAFENFQKTVVAAASAAASGITEAQDDVRKALDSLFDPLTQMRVRQDAAVEGTLALIDGLEGLGDGARRQAPALDTVSAAADKVTKATREAAKAVKENAEIWRQSQRELDDYQREWDRVAEAQRRTAVRFAEQEQDLRNEIMLLGLSTEARKVAIIALQADSMARDENGNVVAEQAAKYRELLTAAANADVAAEAAREFETIWLDAANSVGDALTTALFDGASSGADAIKDVMEQLARDLVRFWLQQNIVIPLQQQVMGGPGGMGGGGFQLGSGFMGIAAGGLMGYGATGSIGGALGGAAGSWVGGIGATMAAQAMAAGAIGSTLGAVLGSALPIVGTLLGAAIGDWIGGLFGDDPKPRIRINSSGAGIGNIGTRGTTALGTLAFNADDLEDTRGTERELLQALQAIDQGFVTLVETFDLGAAQLDALRDAASGWSVDLRNSAITAEAVLGSRFGALLGTFEEHIVGFVGAAGTLEERMGRLTEALFIDAAAATGDLVDDFDTLVGLLDRFGREGEAVDVTYGRLLQSTRLFEDALSMMGQQLDLGRDAFVEFAAEIADAAGGLERATALWSNYFETFYSEQERAELLVSRSAQQAAEEFADIGLALDEFTGPGGLQRFRDRFEDALPTLTPAEVAEWLEAANALGFLSEAMADLDRILREAADSAAEATAQFRQLGNSTKPSGPPGLDFDLGGLNPGLPADPDAPASPLSPQLWIPPSIDVGSLLDGVGAGASGGGRNRDLDLLLGDYSNLKDRDKLQFALEGLRSGEASAEDVLSIGRRLYASGSDYNALFDQVRAIQSGAADAAMAERPIERETVTELQSVRRELAEVKSLLGLAAEYTGKTAESVGVLAQEQKFGSLADTAARPRSSREVIR